MSVGSQAKSDRIPFGSSKFPNNCAPKNFRLALFVVVKVLAARFFRSADTFVFTVFAAFIYRVCGSWCGGFSTENSRECYGWIAVKIA